MSTIAAGDLVIVYSSRDQIDSLTVTAGKILQSRFGSFKHDTMVGVPFGTKFPSSNGRGFVYLLKPTPELWTLALPHRTQILYAPDIAFITSFLDVKAGSRVIEAGTGSGSFSHSLVRSVGSKGKVYSFEFHEERYKKAREEFKDHGLDEIIQIKHQNVYRDGFEVVDEVDSVFLDVPAPWEALPHAKIALRKDLQSRVCCFSPCIEQVIRTCSTLAELGFSDITMYECLTRSHEPTPYVAPSISTAIERIQAVESKKGRRREGQIAEAKKKREEREKKRVREDEIAASGEVEVEGEPSAKRLELEGTGTGTGTEGEDVDMAGSESGAGTPGTSTPKGASAKSDGKKLTKEPKPHPPHPQHSGPRVYTSKPANTHLRGHTSFLTFATLLPSVNRPLDTTRDTTLKKADAVEVNGTNGDVSMESEATGGEKSLVADETDEFPLSPGAREALLAVDETAFIEA
ncbi:tRNA (adenine57-N1/adenine58-N1)-methyltransferase catalytic subunit, partial [Phenoliferia sp. Uapishka_3]